MKSLSGFTQAANQTADYQKTHPNEAYVDPFSGIAVKRIEETPMSLVKECSHQRCDDAPLPQRLVVLQLILRPSIHSHALGIKVWKVTRHTSRCRMDFPIHLENAATHRNHPIFAPYSKG